MVYRGEGRITGRGAVTVTHDGTSHELAARNVVVAVGSFSKLPPIEGLRETHPWSNREATLARELPRSLLVLGGGPTGCELAQVYARFGVPTTIVQSGPRLVPSDHPRNSEVIRFALERDGVTVRTGVRAVAARAGAGTDGAHVIDLGDGSTAEGHEILLAVGRAFPLDGLGLEHYGVSVSGPDAYHRDGALRLADGLWVAGDPAGPELHTHQGHYQGELVVRMALGEAIEPDYRALPRATYMDPEAGLGRPDAGPGAGGRARRVRVHGRLHAHRQGLLGGGRYGARDDHRGPRLARAVGAAIACPDASAAIHECVLAIKARVKVDVLAETIHAFPSTSRILNGLFAEALGRLGNSDDRSA